MAEACLMLQVEGLVMDSTEALAYLGQIGERTSLRHAVQLLTPAAMMAKTSGRDEISTGDVEQVAELFHDAKFTAKLLAEQADKYVQWMMCKQIYGCGFRVFYLGFSGLWFSLNPKTEPCHQLVDSRNVSQKMPLFMEPKPKCLDHSGSSKSSNSVALAKSTALCFAASGKQQTHLLCWHSSCIYYIRRCKERLVVMDCSLHIASFSMIKLRLLVCPLGPTRSSSQQCFLVL